MKKRSLFLYIPILFFLMGLLSQAQAAQQRPDLNELLPLNPKVTKGVLANGFTYYILPNQYPKKKLELRLIVNAGSLQESDHERGLAHFMEHMNFNGTSHFKKNEMVHYLQSIGVRFGADLNAYTSFDRTVYMLPVSTEKPEHVVKAFQIMADWAHTALLKTEDIDAERGVVLEESRLGKGARERMQDTIISGLSKAYAERMPIGKDSIIKHFAPDTLRAFHRAWYRPDMEALAVVGDIDVKEAERLIKENFEHWEMPADAPTHTPTLVAPFTQSRAVLFTDKELPQHLLFINFNTLTRTQDSTLGDYKKGLLRSLLFQAFNLRLQERMQSAKPPFSFAQAELNQGFLRGYENMIAIVGIGAEGWEVAVRALAEEVKRTQRDGFTEQELEIARQALLSQVEKAYKEREKTPSARLIGEFVRHYLEKEPMPGIEHEYAYTQALLPLCTLEEVRTLFNNLTHDEHIFSMLAVPTLDKQKYPTTSEALRDNIARVWASAQAEKKIETRLDKNLLDAQPVPGTIRSVKEKTPLGTTDFQLSNGVKVVLKTTDFKDDEVLVRMVAKGGINNLPAAQKYTANYLTDFQPYMGYGKFNGMDLSKVLAGKNVGLAPYLTENTHGFSGQSSLTDINTFFELLYLQTTEPREDRALFDSYITRQKSAVQAVLQDPFANFADTLSRVRYHDHPYTPVSVPRPAYFDSVSLTDAQQIYKDYFTHIAQPTLFVVGNITREQLQPLLEKYVASLPVDKDRAIDFKDVHLRAAAGNGVFQYYKGKEEKSLIDWTFNKQDLFSEQKEVQYALLESVLNMLLIDEIREKKSWVYGLNVSIDLEKIPYEHVGVTMRFPCGPQNVDSILTKVREELTQVMSKKKVVSPYLQKAKKQYVENLRVQTQTNGYWLRELVAHHILSYRADEILQRAEIAEAVEVKTLQALAKNLFQDKYMFRAILYPEVKK